MSAEQTRYEMAVQQMTKELFWKHPEIMAERIASHYCRNAIVALELAKLVKIRRDRGSSESIEQAIGYFSELIKRSHVADFGTEIIDIRQNESRMSG